MSLCVAWKYQDAHVLRIGFAADSCVTVQNKEGCYEMPYGGVKVLALPVRIAPPGKVNEPPFERIYGMAFVDGFLPAFLLKESLGEALQNLQVLGVPSEVTFKQICDFVLKFHKHTHRQLREHIKLGYEVSFFFGGMCPSTRHIHVAKFFVDFDSEEPTYEMILEGGGVRYETLGQQIAQDRFRELFDLNLAAPPCRVEFSVWRRLREVLRDPKIKFVNGVIQHGNFDGNGNFSFAGTMDLEFVKGRLHTRTFIRGVDIEAVHHAQFPGDLSVTYNYVVPFHEDMAAFDSSSFWGMDGPGVVIDEPITVVPHDKNWAQDYASEQAFLEWGLGDRVIEFQHVGSTAVPDIAARPIIDILIGVQSIDDPCKPPFELSLLDYDFLGDCGIPGRLVYRKRKERNFDLHIVEHGSKFWNSGLQLRDYLLANLDDAKKFGLEKVKILNSGAWTAKRYLSERANYLEKLINKANA